MHSQLKEKCGDCYYWICFDLLLATSGECCRFPNRVAKYKIDGCGEFKERKVVEVLREGKKR
jgi:hypothetical protein